MQMSYTRGTDFCKGLEEAPPSSFQTTRSLSVLLCLVSSALSIYRSVHKAGILDSDSFRYTGVSYKVRGFFSTNSQVQKLLFYLYKSN